jgi:hypothetical protein
LRKVEDISDKMADILDESGTRGRTNHSSVSFVERKRIRRRGRRRREGKQKEGMKDKED